VFVRAALRQRTLLGNSTGAKGMKLLYDASDLKRILKKHHSYSGEPIKVDGYTQDILDVEVANELVIVTIGEEDDDNDD
jgi:hypothetical protein